MAAYGFEANLEQSEESIVGIRLMLSVYPGLGALLSAVFMSFYKLDDAFVIKIGNELQLKRQTDKN